MESTDLIPKGKRKSLREKEREVQRYFADGITPYGGQFTVSELAKKYFLQKTGVKPLRKQDIRQC